MSIRLKPNFKRTPDLIDILGSYTSAEHALDAGNYYVALLKARAENKPEIESAALIMCGAVQRGLKQPNPGKTPQIAFGHWCLGYKETAVNILEGQQGFENLLALLKMSTINVFILYGPHTRHGVPFQELEGFAVRSVQVERNQRVSSLSEMVPKGFKPDIIIVLDIYGQRLPDDLYNFNGPVIFLNYDFDVQLPHQYQDLQLADLIVVNGAYEHYFLNKIYHCPVTVFPSYPAVTTLPAYPTSFCVSKPSCSKEIDFLHTGLSFIPIMREKAQFLFRIATIDNPDLNIRIHHGYMEDKEYHTNIDRTKFMPIFCAKMRGSIQTRTIDAICNGSFVLHGGDDVAIELFEAGRLAIRNSTPHTLEGDVAHNISTFPEDWQNYTENHQNVADELKELFLDPNERSARFFKFCLFEWARTGYRRKRMLTRRTTSVAGFHQCLALGRVDDKNGHSWFSVALYRAIEAVLTVPKDEGRREIVKLIFLKASTLYPESVALLFNYARFLWMIGKNGEACEKFENLLHGLNSYIFEPTRDIVWLHLFQASSEMMPPQDYFFALTRDLAKGDGKTINARSVIGATALSYLALDKLQKENLRDGLDYLDRALDLYSDHFPAARLRFKALHALGEDWQAVSKAFEFAINLYPPSLTDLMPYGVSAELAQNNEAEALSLVKTWAYFITRCTWEWETSHNIPDVNWKTVRTFFHQLPETLQTSLKKRFPEALG